MQVKEKKFVWGICQINQTVEKDDTALLPKF